jgi:hypothetical protein
MLVLETRKCKVRVPAQWFLGRALFLSCGWSSSPYVLTLLTLSPFAFSWGSHQEALCVPFPQRWAVGQQPSWKHILQPHPGFRWLHLHETKLERYSWVNYSWISDPQNFRVFLSQDLSMFRLAGLELAILLPHLLKCWDYSCAPPCLATKGTVTDERGYFRCSSVLRMHCLRLRCCSRRSKRTTKSRKIAKWKHALRYEV